MKKYLTLIIILPLTFFIGYCASKAGVENYKHETIPQPPAAKKIPITQKIQDFEYIDNYHWLIDDTRSDSEVISYIQKENDYAEYILSGMQSLKDTIFNEIISRIGEEYENAPIRWGDYYYYSRREEGKPYYAVSYTHLTLPTN